MVFALIEGQRYGWWDASTRAADDLGWTAELSPIAPVAVVGLASLAAFVVVERRRHAAGRVVLLDVSLLAISSFATGTWLRSSCCSANSGCCSGSRCS